MLFFFLGISTRFFRLHYGSTHPPIVPFSGLKTTRALERFTADMIQRGSTAKSSPLTAAK
jgi:hypothetical protein